MHVSGEIVSLSTIEKDKVLLVATKPAGSAACHLKPMVIENVIRGDIDLLKSI